MVCGLPDFQLQTLVSETTPIGVGILDRNLNIQSVDAGFANLFCCCSSKDIKDIIGRNLGEIARFFVLTWEEVEKKIKNAFLHNIPTEICASPTFDSQNEKKFNFKFFPCKGTEDWIICYVYQIEKNEYLKVLDAKYDLIFNSMAAGVMIVNMDSQIAYINDLAVKMIGRQNEVLVGKKYLDVFGGRFPYMPKYIWILEKALYEGISTTNCIELVEGKKHDCYFQCDAIALRDNSGAQLGVLLIIKDVTERVLLEERVRSSEKLALIGELAAGAAHEIRNPLTAIKGFLQLLQRKEELEEDDYLRISLEEVQKIEAIISDLLLLANPVFTSFSYVQVIDAIRGALEGLNPILSQRAIEINFKGSESIPPVWGDLQQLRIAFRNVIKNGIEAMPSGGKLTINIERINDSIAVNISDTGVGINQEVLPRIFNPFFTLKDDRVGLGLAVVKRVVENHTGYIEVESKEGSGTTFRIVIPIKVIGEAWCG